MRDARKLARTRSILGPKIRAYARARSCSGFQYSYSLGARDFDARPIPIVSDSNMTNKEFPVLEMSKLPKFPLSLAI